MPRAQMNPLISPRGGGFELGAGHHARDRRTRPEHQDIRDAERRAGRRHRHVPAPSPARPVLAPAIVEVAAGHDDEQAQARKRHRRPCST